MSIFRNALNSAHYVDALESALDDQEGALKAPKRTHAVMGDELRVIHSDEPIVATKLGYIFYSDNDLWFSGGGKHTKQKAEGVASCDRHEFFASYRQYGLTPPLGGITERHDAPHPDCMCGFYGVKPGVEVDGYEPDRNSTVLDVELYGKVIHHEKGYRAEKQRIMAVRLGGCGGFLCEKPPELLVFDVTNILAKKVVLAAPFCLEHGQGLATDKWETITLERAANLLGTEVVAG